MDQIGGLFQLPEAGSIRSATLTIPKLSEDIGLGEGLNPWIEGIQGSSQTEMSAPFPTIKQMLSFTEALHFSMLFHVHEACGLTITSQKFEW